MSQRWQEEVIKDKEEWEYILRKYLLLLATVMATVTYSAGFNPPGGLWQEAGAGHLAGDPIIRDVRYIRYAFFFYSNAIAFASSLLVAVITLLVTLIEGQQNLFIKLVWVLRVVMVFDLISLMTAHTAGACRDNFTKLYSSLLLAASIAAYLLLQVVLAFFKVFLQTQDSNSDEEELTKGCKVLVLLAKLILRKSQASGNSDDEKMKKRREALMRIAAFVVPNSSSAMNDEQLLKKARKKEQMKKGRKVLMLLATFAVSLTYYAGLNTPGGFWDKAEDGHRPGDAILTEHHGTRFRAFFVCNNTAFAASIFTIALLLDKKLHMAGLVFYLLNGCFVVALVSLIGAYAAGSSRDTGTSTYVASLGLAVVLRIIMQLIIAKYGLCWGYLVPGCLQKWWRDNGFLSWQQLKKIVKEWWFWKYLTPDSLQKWWNDKMKISDPMAHDVKVEKQLSAQDKARSLVLLLTILVATITYQAGLDPPGGVWQENGGDGQVAGDPVLQTTNPRRYKVFFYCNSVAFVASLVAIVVIQRKLLLRRHVLEAVVLLDLLGLMGAYAAGSCRDTSASIHVIAMASVVLVYVGVHVIIVFFFKLHQYKGEDIEVEKRRKQLLLFAILVATVTYQAGLSPPGGFLLRDAEATGRHAGDPILKYNSGRRYTAFFYCNSASFVMSMALIAILLNPNVYRPVIRSYVLPVCTAAGLFALVGAYAVGSTQRRATSVFMFAVASALLLLLSILFLLFFAYAIRGKKKNRGEAEAEPPVAVEQDQNNKDTDLKKRHTKRKYLMLLGILVASVTYQAGLDQPGGVWQHTGDGHVAGDPVMKDLMGRRYQAFFYCNSNAFVASIVVIVVVVLLLLPRLEERKDYWFKVLNMTVLVGLLLLLAAYAVGSTRDSKTSTNIAALIAAVLGYSVVHVMLSHLISYLHNKKEETRSNVRDTASVAPAV